MIDKDKTIINDPENLKKHWIIWVTLLNIWPKWEPINISGVYPGHYPFHVVSVELVLNIITGCVSPQFHVVFDKKIHCGSHEEGNTPRKLGKPGRETIRACYSRKHHSWKIVASYLIINHAPTYWGLERGTTWYGLPRNTSRVQYTDHPRVNDRTDWIRVGSIGHVLQMLVIKADKYT